MKKLVLEALAAWLALAAMSGQVRAAIQDSDAALPTSAASNRGGTRSMTGVHALADSPLELVHTMQSNGSFGFSPSGADELTPDHKNGYRTELARRAIYNESEAGASRRVVLAAAGVGGQIIEKQTVRDTGSSERSRIHPVANATRAPGATVPIPEPGSWGTALAGLLGVIAIARRRLSL